MYVQGEGNRRERDKIERKGGGKACEVGTHKVVLVRIPQDPHSQFELPGRLVSLRIASNCHGAREPMSQYEHSTFNPLGLIADISVMVSP